MKLLKIAAMVFLLASLAAMMLCIFTDWNDGLYLPLALSFGIVGNGINVLSERRGSGERKREK